MTALSTFREEIAAAGPCPVVLSSTSFADDDIYVYQVKDRVLVRQIGCKTVEAEHARFNGVSVAAGQTWDYGRAAKYLGLEARKQ